MDDRFNQGGIEGKGPFVISLEKPDRRLGDLLVPGQGKARLAQAPCNPGTGHPAALILAVRFQRHLSFEPDFHGSRFFQIENALVDLTAKPEPGQELPTQKFGLFHSFRQIHAVSSPEFRNGRTSSSRPGTRPRS